LLLGSLVTLEPGWNLLAPKDLQFDPAPAFVFWLFISNVIQLLLMPLIMVGQIADSHTSYDAVAKAVDKSLPLNVAATTISVWATIVATIAPKQTARLVVKKAANVDYFCKYHPNMKGRVVVTP
jgi:hypothetical protein